MPESPDNHSESYSTTASPRQSEVALGIVVALSEDGFALVDWPENPRSEPVLALATTPISSGSVGQHVALLFAQGSPGKPVIIGMIRNPFDDVLKATGNHDAGPSRRQTDAEEHLKSLQNQESIDCHVDGHKVTIAGEKEVELKCGKASITLTSAGKVIIRGEYVMTRSSGPNRIKGGTVQIN